jgi:uridine kinase
VLGDRALPVGDFLRILPEADNPPIVGAIVNGELRELTYPIGIDSKVCLVTMGDEDGMRIYRRSLVFLLETAFEECFPDAELRVEHSISSGGYFCRALGRPLLSGDELAVLEDRMHQMVADDLPFVRQEVPLAEAMAYFQNTGKIDKVRLLAHRRKNYLTLYQLKDFRDYHHGYMVPSTGYLRWFNC